MERMAGEAVLLRIFLGESDKFKGKLLYEAIVEAARRKGLAGATVLRGIMGYGINSVIHTFKLFALSEDMPVVIEFVDTREKIEELMPVLDEIITQANTGVMITKEKVEVVRYTSRK